jgi:uncharacterized protein
MQRFNRPRPIHLIIFAKAPIPGFAKTRLIPTLGREGSANLAYWLLQQSLYQAQAALQLGCVQSLELCCSPNLSLWPINLDLPGWSISEQGTGDLGQRMGQAAQAALEQSAVLLLGTDCPTLTAARIEQATAALAHLEAVLIPALDGGYTLLGLNRWVPQIFSDMPWSTDQVAALTQQRLQAAQVPYSLLPPLRDIDEAEDLVDVPKEAWAGSGMVFKIPQN